MEYVFEDRQGCVLDQVFKYIYSKDEYSHIHFAGNNSEAAKFATDLVENGNTAILYLDMVPGNSSINQLYSELRDISEENENRLIVLPIYGSEYILIKAFRDTSIFKDALSVDICIQKRKYYDSPLYTSEKTLKDYKTFERYCKLVLERNTINCACSKSRIMYAGIGYSKNKVKNYFYNNDCLYAIKQDSILSKDEKALLIMKSLGIGPITDRFENTKILSRTDLWKAHREAIIELNSFVNDLKDIEHLNDLDLVEFKEIKVI